MMKSLSVEIPSHFITELNQKAKQKFPMETFGYLLGKKNEDSLIVEELFFPKDLDRYCKPDCVLVQDSWERSVKRYSKKHELIIVSEWHTHPWTQEEIKKRQKQVNHWKIDTSPSEVDLERNKLGYLIGICVLTETKNHRLRARTKFWGPSIPIILKTNN